MKYRTVHVYPQANAQITKAIERIVSGEMGAREMHAPGAAEHHRRPAPLRACGSSGCAAGAQGDGRRPCSGWSARRKRAFVLGLAPALVVLAAITIAPAVYLVLTSLTPLNLTMPRHGLGLLRARTTTTSTSGRTSASTTQRLDPGEAVVRDGDAAAADRARRRAAAEPRQPRCGASRAPSSWSRWCCRRSSSASSGG